MAVVVRGFSWKKWWAARWARRVTTSPGLVHVEGMLGLGIRKGKQGNKASLSSKWSFWTVCRSWNCKFGCYAEKTWIIRRLCPISILWRLLPTPRWNIRTRKWQRKLNTLKRPWGSPILTKLESLRPLAVNWRTLTGKWRNWRSLWHMLGISWISVLKWMWQRALQTLLWIWDFSSSSSVGLSFWFCYVYITVFKLYV